MIRRVLRWNRHSDTKNSFSPSGCSKEDVWFYAPHRVGFLSQRRLCLFEGNRLIRSFPVGIGGSLPDTRRALIGKVPYPCSWPGGP